MWIVHVNDPRRELADDLRELPRCREVYFAARREGDEIGSFKRSAVEFALAVRHEHSTVAQGTLPEDR